MSLAPDWNVPPNVSPFKHLPVLARCVHRGEPITPMEGRMVVDGEIVHGPLCRACADASEEK